MITMAEEVYAVTALAMQNCRKHGYHDIAQQLDDAMHRGSSGMETLGAIKSVFITQRSMLEKVVDKSTLNEVTDYIDKVFGIG